MLPEHMPLWHKDCFDLKATEEKTDTGNFSPMCLKTGHKFPLRMCPLFITPGREEQSSSPELEAVHNESV